MEGLQLIFLAFCLIGGLELGLGNPSWGRMRGESAEYCTTFEEKPGRIIDYTQCPYIVDIVDKHMAKQPLTARELDITRYSRRENFNSAVCCEDEVNPSGLELLKESEPTCGEFTVYNIVNGHEIRMGSRPWMALLEYKEGKPRFRCGATLITPRYILTAAHCVTADLISVRLGEHRISTEKDCMAYGNTVDCMPYPQDIAVENTIVHPDFSRWGLLYDIALIRLKRAALITDNVKTICLPLYEDVQLSIRRRSVQQVTGWGVHDILTREQSDVPNEASVNRLHLDECHKTRSVTLLENQMCFNASGKDSCDGDSGGPLSFPYIYQGAQRFVQMGIVSYGPYRCGHGETAVYTNVISFLPWITQNIRP